MNWKEKILRLLNSLFFRHYDLNILKGATKLVAEMRPTEKVIIFILSIATLIFSLFLIDNFKKQFFTSEPTSGGSFVEGIIGNPRFIDPTLAVSNVDNDVVSLVFAGLLKKNENSNFTNELAEKYTVIEENKVYEFELKDSAYFHNNTKITTDDIIFTIEKIKEQKMHNELQQYWNNVKVEKIDDKKIRFILDDPNIPILKMLTIGIISSKTTKDEKVIGAGPYKIAKINKSKNGLIESIDLESFQRYTLGKPKIANIKLKFFTKEKELFESYDRGEIDNFVNLNKKIENPTISHQKKEGQLPKIFLLKINTDNSTLLKEADTLKILKATIAKKEITQNILNGKSKISTLDNSTEELNNILKQGGWYVSENDILTKKVKKDNIELSLSISVSNDPLLVKIANILKDEWKKFGIDIKLKIFEDADLQQNIVQQKKYEILLDTETLEEYERENIISIALFSPVFEYIYKDSIKNIKFKNTLLAEERFTNIKDWFIETKTIWQFWKY